MTQRPYPVTQSPHAAPVPTLARRGSGGRGAAADTPAADVAPASAASCGSAALNMPLIASQAARVLTVSVGSSVAAELACNGRVFMP